MDPISKKVHQAFRSQGMMLEKNALDLAKQHLEGSSFEDLAIEGLVELMGGENLSSTVVTEAALRKAIRSSSATNESKLLERTSVVVDLFRLSRILWDPVRKTFYYDKRKPTVAADAESKIEIYRQRFYIVEQRLSRHPLFSKPQFSLPDQEGEGYIELKQLQSLVGDTGAKRYVLGMLTKVEDDRLFIEDFSARMPIDLSRASVTDGIYTENSIVVAEGSLRPDGVFEAVALGMPPVESKATTWEIFEGIDFFGAGRLSREELELLREKESEEQIFVVLSDVFLDESSTTDKLVRLFESFNDSEIAPKAFVIMGNFRSISASDSSPQDFREELNKLGRLIRKYRRLVEKSAFIFMPGTEDHGLTAIIPRLPFPNIFFEELKETGLRVILAPNPCRLRYCTQEMVFFRQDLHVRMRRCAQLPTNNNQSYFDHIMCTLLQQGHLCPTPIQGQPVYWEFDHTLHLYPMPDVLVLGDDAPMTSGKFQDCVCMCTGSFSEKGTFMVYRPSSRTAECSNVSS